MMTKTVFGAQRWAFTTWKGLIDADKKGEITKQLSEITVSMERLVQGQKRWGWN